MLSDFVASDETSAEGGGRILAIGDIHGCAAALESLLDFVGPTQDDTLVLLGDVVDRGPDSRAVVERLIALERECSVVFIMGNHEEMMRNVLRGSFMQAMWFANGGEETIKSYGGHLDNVPPAHLRFLLSARPYWETETEIYVHATLEAGVSLRNQESVFLRWKHLGGNERPHISGKRVICGHTPQADGRPLVYPGWVCIDTAACSGGYLSCLNVITNELYQTNERRERRKLSLA